MDLVYAGSGIGNVVLATPVCKALGEVDLCIGLQEVPGIEELFKIPSVRRVITQNTAPPDRRYDKVVLTRWFHPHYFPGDYSPGTIKGNIKFVDVDDQIHEITNNLHSVGGDFTPEVNYPITPIVCEHKTIGIHAGGKSQGSWISKRWDKYQELADILKEQGHKVVLFGVGNDDFIEDTNKNFFGVKDIYLVAGLINACDHFISNDTGLMHIRASMGKPQIAIVCGLGYDRWVKNDITFYNPEAKYVAKKNAKDISVDEVLNLLEE